MILSNTNLNILQFNKTFTNDTVTIHILKYLPLSDKIITIIYVCLFLNRAVSKECSERIGDTRNY